MYNENTERAFDDDEFQSQVSPINNTINFVPVTTTTTILLFYISPFDLLVCLSLTQT